MVVLSKARSSTTTGNVFSVVSSSPAVQTLLQRVEKGEPLSLRAISPAAQPFFAALLAQIFRDRPLLVVSADLKSQEVVHQDIQTWVGTTETPRKPLFYPAWETLPHESKLPHVDIISDRLETLTALSIFSTNPDQPAPIVVASLAAVLQKTFPPGELQKRTRIFKAGDVVDPLDLIEWLEEQGYEPEAQVSQKGTIALRGGILDLWPLTSPWPIRFEFFGDELTSLRYFDPIAQISKEEIANAPVPPGGEIGILKRALMDLKESTGPATEASPSAIANPQSIFDHLPANTIYLFCEPETLLDHAERYESQVPENDPFYISWDSVKQTLAKLGSPCVEISESAEVSEAPESNVKFQGLDLFRPIGERPPEPHIAEAQRKEFFAQLHRWSRQDFTIHVFCNNDGERQRFEEVWWEYGLGNTSALQIRTAALARGFVYEEAKIVVVTDAEIFGRYRIQRPRRLKTAHAQTTRSLLDINFAELEEGDYVVHLQHGIGRYLGLQPMPKSQGRKPLHDGGGSSEPGEECLVIEYAPSDPTQPAPKLYVPVSEAHLVGKYVGAGKARPALNTLGGTRWAKTKAQAEHAVRDLAGEMLRIQAVRESQQGHAFPADTGWQREFENSFLYEETPDQWKAILATKKDLESPKPMDRLICGDVGYGKTEVAIRAAFKVAMGGKQVAVLVPTTVLAQQHYNNFRDRMADYPVRIELLTRFRSRRQQNEALRSLAAGSVDIFIGTHRLIQEDIQFKDLGLVIIDEEQRFGVMHKEKFKQIRTLVDVLTLSATPIPRTLYLALAGARDMSTIETPPLDRLPVETIVTQYDERIIRDAIQRELNRGGQVFFLHNRVLDIENVALKLKTLVPQARLVVGHGQMHADDLEEVMTKFINGEADVLLSTTIIESGLDIPNANTIIIDRADRFGLSDLYQLRGRVGRYKHQAYAYLLLPRHAGLLSDARKRLSAIKQYSKLGSGFKIAMRDLEIRGAGSLLGSQQSGHIAAVGFELYCQLLKQSVSSLKGEKVKPRVEIKVHLDFLAMSPEEAASKPAKPPKTSAKSDDLAVSIGRDVAVYHSEPVKEEESVPVPVSNCYIPLNYISEAHHRIEIYRKLAQSLDQTNLRDLKAELRDRFGPIPPAVELMLKVAELKILAADRNITSIETKESKLMIMRNNDYVMMSGKFPRLTKTAAMARLNEIKRLLLAL